MMKKSYDGTLLKVMFVFWLAVNGCAGPGKRLEPPRISLVHLEVQEAKIFETIFQIELRVLNTNAVPLAVKGVDCTVDINDKEFAQGVSDVHVDVPAHGTAIVPMTVYSSLVNMVQGVAGLQNESSLRYHIKGRLRVSGGFMMPSKIPFDTKGEIALER
jgi:LEA14-like dessication related protein